MQIIVADCCGGIQSLFKVACFEDLLRALSVMRPHTREEVSLQLEPDGEGVCLSLARAHLRRANLVCDPEQILDVVTNLMRYYIGLSELQGGEFIDASVYVAALS